MQEKDWCIQSDGDRTRGVFSIVQIVKVKFLKLIFSKVEFSNMYLSNVRLSKVFSLKRVFLIRCSTELKVQQTAR